jgi:hypothetical protein
VWVKNKLLSVRTEADFELYYRIPPYTSHVLCAKRATGASDPTNCNGASRVEIVGQLKIIESLGLKPVSHLTVLNSVIMI